MPNTEYQVIKNNRQKAVQIMKNVKAKANPNMDVDRVIKFMRNMHESNVTGALKANCVVTKRQYMNLAKDMARVNADAVQKSSHTVFIVTDGLNARPVTYKDFISICNDTIKNLKEF